MRIALPLLALALASCTAAGPRDRYERLLTPTANPSRVVAAELAFARAAQEDGQWTAFRDYSTGDAVMFVPQAVNAHEWLAKQTDPAEAVKWQPHQVWSSCDGTLAVTKGAWQRPDGSSGYFTTVWQRQRNGEYKWVLDQGDTLAVPLPAPDFVQTRVAKCNAEQGVGVTTFERAAETGRGASQDASLSYEWAVMADGARRVLVRMHTDEGLAEVLDSEVAAPTE
ncbi:hypothetical protein K3172_03455 [Qipengyuania sp. 6B39]|uniref:hypothetical protein n=1 Tax=Qipengyuania proteolytica TaxID=2867239 RepID=UPI001C8AC229|nr:hypothetical protein [Qipengyuania proteolytica]MBX7494912.1 hypothetical protein [Qipengyuania proteolytica]